MSDKKRGLSVFCFLMASLLSFGSGNAGASETLEKIGSFILPTGLNIGGVEFGGISGLDYDVASDRFIAISDDRSQRAPARYYDLSMKLSQAGIDAVDIEAVHFLGWQKDNRIPLNGADPESIRFSPHHTRFFWSSEQDGQGLPTISEADFSGRWLRSFSLPDYYLPNAEKTKGVYKNVAFEGLATSIDGRDLLAITENGLIQDGDRATHEKGSLSRIIAFDIASGTCVAEYVYETDPIQNEPAVRGGYSDNGASEMLALSLTDFLVLERSYADGVGFNIRLYRISLEGATDVRGFERLAGRALQPVSKRLVATIADGDFGIERVDNLEAMCFGPLLAGRRTLILASDNNFNADEQTQFHLFFLPLTF